jgi:signal transduction histidine kinase/ActR/RegA family two-component response regulator
MQLEFALFGIMVGGFAVGIIAVAMLMVLALAIGCVRLSVLLRHVSADRSELIAAQKDMEAAIKAKSEFLVTMSHEIRTPMNALTSFSEILTQRVSQNSSAALKEETEGILDIIKKSSSDLLTIINDVFDYIKIDANLLAIDSIPMSIKQVIHDVCHVEKPNVIAKHLELTIKYNGDIPPTILCDPVRMRQILSNLISNAIKFTEKGTITILCEIVDIGDASRVLSKPATDKGTGGEQHKDSFSASSKQLKISVIDTGIGLSPAHVQELHKPFRHVDPALPHKKRGTGLGLNIAMRLATLLDGTIKIESVLGQGSTFSLLLNVYVPEGASAILLGRSSGEKLPGSQLHAGLDIRVPKKKPEQPPPDKSRPLRNVRVLVVEDMVVNQVIVATLLRDAGAQVELADNGAIGVQKVMQDMDDGLYFDVILMDMQMPVMDGYEATEYLRKHDYSRPIIAVTAHALTGDREKTLKSGCDDYIAKPIDNLTLIDMIKKHAGVS